jgi:hypothetical protein
MTTVGASSGISMSAGGHSRPPPFTAPHLHRLLTAMKSAVSSPDRRRGSGGGGVGGDAQQSLLNSRANGVTAGSAVAIASGSPQRAWGGGVTGRTERRVQPPIVRCSPDQAILLLSDFIFGVRSLHNGRCFVFVAVSSKERIRNS